MLTAMDGVDCVIVLKGRAAETIVPKLFEMLIRTDIRPDETGAKYHSLRQTGFIWRHDGRVLWPIQIPETGNALH